MQTAGESVESLYLSTAERAGARMLAEYGCTEPLWPRWLPVIKEWLGSEWRYEPKRGEYTHYTAKALVEGELQRTWVLGPHGCEEQVDEAWLVLGLSEQRWQAEERMLSSNAARIAGHLLLHLGRVDNPWKEAHGEASVAIFDRAGAYVAEVSRSFVAEWTEMREDGLGPIELRMIHRTMSPVCRWDGVWVHLRLLVYAALHKGAFHPWDGVVESVASPYNDCRNSNVRLAACHRSQSERWSWSYETVGLPRLQYKCGAHEYRMPLVCAMEERGELRTWLRLLSAKLERPHLIHNCISVDNRALPRRMQHFARRSAKKDEAQSATQLSTDST